MRRSIAALAVTVAALIVATNAGADPVTGGKTVLKPDVDMFEALADMSMSVGATGAARDAVKGVVFPISGGDLTEGPKGTIDHRGGLVFARNTAEGGIVKFTQFVVKLGKNKTKLFAKSDHAAVRFMDLDTNAVITNAAGTRVTIKGAKATLAKAGAGVLSDTFDFPFRKGIPMGTLTIKAELG